jgi:CRP-like cAMP-binding protein
MIKERLKPEHMPVLSQYGLEGAYAADMYVHHYKANEFIIRQGYPCPYVLLVLEGKLKVFNTVPNGRTLLFCYDTTGGMIGEVEFASDSVDAASSVQALTDVLCIGIPRARYKSELKSSITFMNALSEALAQKLFRSSKNSAAAILQPLAARLCAYICISSADGCFSEKLTDVAALLGTSYRHLLRTLSGLCAQGVLEKTPRGYFVSDEATLARISGDCYLL